MPEEDPNPIDFAAKGKINGGGGFDLTGKTEEKKQPGFDHE